LSTANAIEEISEMLLAPLRWLARNLSTLLLAFLLAVVVWVTAVISNDPNEEATYRAVTLERIGLGSDLLMVNDIPSQVRITMRAPRSVWAQLNSDPRRVQAWVDLTGLGSGNHTLPVRVRIDASPIRLVNIDPDDVEVTLEQLISREFQVQLVVSGESPLGYRKGEPQIEPLIVNVSGPESNVNRVVQVRASVDVTGFVETLQRAVDLEALDENDQLVENVTLIPRVANVTQPISLEGGFKNVVIRVVTKGQVANGFRLTNILVSPPTITLFSSDPQLLDSVPGFVDTLPVDLTNLNDDVEMNVGLNLPDGVSMMRVPSVLVQVSVAAIEGSLTLTLPVEVIGLEPGLEITISPSVVDVIIAGPLNLLDQLTAASFRVVLDLTGLPPGVYQKSPVVDLFPDFVRIQTTLPDTVEVTIEIAPTPTATLDVTLTPTPTATPEP
jgi:YbbR domain-containing protein